MLEDSSGNKCSHENRVGIFFNSVVAIFFQIKLSKNKHPSTGNSGQHVQNTAATFWYRLLQNRGFGCPSGPKLADSAAQNVRKFTVEALQI